MMARAQVSRSAIDASLWFILARSLSAEHPQQPSAPELDAELVEDIGNMLTEQNAAHLLPEVLETVRAGRELLAEDASLTLAAQRYDQLRAEFIDRHQIASGKGRTLWPVGSTTALKRAGGSWSAALTQAGLGTSTTPKPAGFGRARFTPGQFEAAIKNFKDSAEDSGVAATYQGYVQWQKEQKRHGRTDLPSGAAIRNSFGSWKAALSSGGERG